MSNNFLKRLFPKESLFGYEYLIKLRFKQLVKLFKSLLMKDDFKKNYNSKIQILIIIDTNRFKNTIDENILGFINQLKSKNLEYKIIGRPPSEKVKVKLKSENIHYYKANKEFFKYLIFSFFIGLNKSIFLFWTKILKQFSPKTVISYMPTEELCKACKKLGITICELQHGAIHPNHEIYQFHKETRKYIPSLFIAWDEKSLKNAKSLSISSRYFLLGYPEFHIQDNFSKLDNKLNGLITLPHSIDYFYRNHKKSNIYKTYNLCVPNLIEIMLNKKFLNIYWTIRLHPLTSKKEIIKINKIVNTLINKGIKIVIDNKSELFNQILNTKFHITLNSSIVQKCSSLNVYSIITCPILYDEEVFKRLSKEGKCTILKPNYSINDLSNAIEKAITFGQKNKKILPDLNFDELCAAILN